MPVKDKNLIKKTSRGKERNADSTVYVSLYNLASSRSVTMISNFDELSPRQYSKYQGDTNEKRYLRNLLIEAMSAKGFTVNKDEWWHFTFGNLKNWSRLNYKYSEIKESL